MTAVWRISKRFDFSASHVLHGLPDDHPCARMHGHNYSVEVEVEGVTDEAVGFVLDYHALAGVKRWLDDTFDHQHLNDRMRGNPSAEHLARLIGQKSPALIQAELAEHGWVHSHDWQVSAVRVHETPKTCAEWRP